MKTRKIEKKGTLKLKSIKADTKKVGARRKNKKSGKARKAMKAMKARKAMKSNIIEDITPIADRLESRQISDSLDQKRSFSPLINQDLVSLKTMAPKDLYENCDDITKIRIGNRCFQHTSPQAKRLLLDNLRSTKHLDCKYFIAPKQYQANCWFNTMFVTLWFSDKGRKFFRFLRQLMIQGEKVNGEKIPHELARVFFIFNMIIEASYNQPSSILNAATRGEARAKEASNSVIKDFDTNYFIHQLYAILMQRKMRVYREGESGNPLEYYKAIIRYLNYDAVSIINVDIEKSASSENIVRAVKREMGKIARARSGAQTASEYTPEIIVVEIMEDESARIRNRPLEIHFSPTITYRLDSCIIRDTGGEHFSSLLTCNGEEMSFDGASYSRLNQFKWKRHLNSGREWGFEGHDLRWSFREGYQMLFYYRI